MDAKLDLTVAAALARLRVMERAIHEHKPWTMECSGVSTEVCLFIREDRVSFVGHFPPMCYLNPADQVSLFCDGDLMRVVSLPEPLSEDGSEVWIDLALTQTVGV